MITGMNHNIMHNGNLYHIQTEESGRKHPHVISHLFLDGVILATEKTSYEEHLALSDDDLLPILKNLMQRSHRAMINRLVTGGYDHLSQTIKRPVQPKPEVVLANLEKTEDETTLQYAKEAENTVARKIAEETTKHTVRLQTDEPSKEEPKEERAPSEEKKPAERAGTSQKIAEIRTRAVTMPVVKRTAPVEQDEDSLDLYMIFGASKKVPRNREIFSLREKIAALLGIPKE
jgi:hypothetical protein